MPAIEEEEEEEERKEEGGGAQIMRTMHGRLLHKIKLFLRIDGSGDDVLLASLISAAKQYLANAGVVEPEDSGEEEGEAADGTGNGSGELSLYELAVSIYVSIIFDGDDKDKLDRAMTAIILQTKNYSGGGDVK